MTTVEKTILSECGKYKVNIERRSQQALEVTGYKWTEEWVEGYGKVDEFWERVSNSLTITDTLENAEKLACEVLRSFR